MSALDKLKMLLGITDNAEDERLTFVLELVIDEIRNYCNISEIPKELQNVLIRICMDVWRGGAYGTDGIPQAVESVRRGDSDITFGASTMYESVQSIMTQYKAQLNAFRNLRW